MKMRVKKRRENGGAGKEREGKGREDNETWIELNTAIARILKGGGKGSYRI